MVFVKIVFAENYDPDHDKPIPEREKGMRLDENLPVQQLYKGVAEKFDMLVDYEGYKLFMLGPSGTNQRNTVVRELLDDESLVDVPEVHPSCRILYIDGIEGRKRLSAQNEEQMREKLRTVEAESWLVGKVYMAVLFYTNAPAGAGPNPKPRVLTDGRGHLPSVEIPSLAPHAFNDGLKHRLFKRGGTVEEVLKIDKSTEHFVHEIEAISGAADLLSFKLGIMSSMCSGVGQFLGSFYPESPVMLELQGSSVIVCFRDVGPVACDSNWLDASSMHFMLASRYSPAIDKSHLTDLYVHYHLVPRPMPEPEPEPEIQIQMPEVEVKVQREEVSRHPGGGLSKMAKIELDLQADVKEDVVETQPAEVKIRFNPDDLNLRYVEEADVKAVDPMIAEVVTQTMLDMVDMVELMADCEEDLMWQYAEGDADDQLDADEVRFEQTLEQLFKAQKVNVAMTDVRLEEHLDADKLMMADLTSEENTPFTQPIRALVERFGQTILMIEDLEESIISAEEIGKAVAAVEKVAAKQKVEREKLHHENLASVGPQVHNAEDDLPDPHCVKPETKRVTKKSRLPKVTQPIETWPEQSYPLTDFQAPMKQAPSMIVSLSEVMKPTEDLQVTALQDDVLIRLYEYAHDKTSTVKQVFMEFDKDGSGSIDSQELYYALRHLGFMVDFHECNTIIQIVETRAADLERKFHTDHKAYEKHRKAEEQLIGVLGVNKGGYQKHVDGKIDYKELLIAVNEAAKRKGLLRKSSRFTDKGALKKRAPGSSILKGAAGASKIKGVKKFQNLNSLYRTHARITGKIEAADMINVEDLDVIGPINAVDALEPNEYGIMSADKLLFPVRQEAAEECLALLNSPTRVVNLDADGIQTQAIAEMLEGLVLDDTQLHKNTLRQMHGDMLTLLVAACEVENLRMFICAVDKVLEGEHGSEHEETSILELVSQSFAMDLPAMTWHQMEHKLLGVGPAMDTFWYCRCKEEFDAEDEFSSCKGMWKQIYCELRFQKHLRSGLDAIPESELSLWDNFLGPHVQTVDLSETGCHDDVVAVCVAYCPNLKYLDLHDSKVTDAAIVELVERVEELVWINIEDTAITGEGVEKLVQAYPNLELVG